MTTSNIITKMLDEQHQKKLAAHGLCRAGRRVALATLSAAVLAVAACASPPPPAPVVQVDPVSAAVSRIAAERDAGLEARQKCAALGMESDQDCRREIAGARLGVDSNAHLGKFVKVD